MIQPNEVPGNLRINKEIDNKYLFKTDSDNKEGDVSLVSSVNYRHSENSNEENEEEEEEEESDDDEDKSSADDMSKGKEDSHNNNKHNEESSSVLISSSNNVRSNIEHNEEEDSDDGTNKTEQNSVFNDEEFLEMFTEINQAPKGRKVAPKYAGVVAPLNINLKNINQSTPFNHNLHIKKKHNNNNTNHNSNNNNSSHINTNTNDDLLLKSNRSGVSLASLSSERNLLHNNNNTTTNSKHKGQMKRNQHINDNIKEEDEDGATSKR